MTDLRRVTEKSGFVIDLGQFYTKIGLTGEASPSFVIPTDPNIFLKKFDLDKKHINIIYKDSLTDDADLEKTFIVFFEDIFFNKFSMDAKNRHVFIVASMLIPKKILMTIQNV